MAPTLEELPGVLKQRQADFTSILSSQRANYYISQHTLVASKYGSPSHYVQHIYHTTDQA